ncbi:MAG: hypothetical protein LBB79_05550 [Prevotellaceae bacterium]|jgi:hypothetical protein|nr:hypothetical protein [Prevotellaceae bacterium]
MKTIYTNIKSNYEISHLPQAACQGHATLCGGQPANGGARFVARSVTLSRALGAVAWVAFCGREVVERTSQNNPTNLVMNRCGELPRYVRHDGKAWVAGRISYKNPTNLNSGSAEKEAAIRASLVKRSRARLTWLACTPVAIHRKISFTKSS